MFLLVFCAFFPSALHASINQYSEVAPIDTTNANDGKPKHLPVHTYIMASYNQISGVLSISFRQQVENITLELIQNESVVSSYTGTFNQGDSYNFDLSIFGSGEYCILIIIGDKQEFYGVYIY